MANSDTTWLQLSEGKEADRLRKAVLFCNKEYKEKRRIWHNSILGRLEEHNISPASHLPEVQV